MIKEVFDKKIINNLDYVIEIISSYFGGIYKEEFSKRGNDIVVSLVRNKGVLKVGESEYYVGEEPLCIKGDCLQIVLPISFLEEKRGNVIFVHLVLHALFNDSLSNEYSELNEVIVDYMANDIAKILKRKNINVTLEDDPVYESDSLYSLCFDIIEPYCEENKRELVEELVNGDASKLCGIDELAFLVEKRINKNVFGEVKDTNFKR